MKNGYSGKTEFWSDNYSSYIRTITFDNNLSNLPSSCTEENLCWDISETPTQKKKVYGYLVDTGLKDSTDNTKPLYNLYIVSEALIFAHSNCEEIFSFKKSVNNKDISNLISINFNNNFNTSNVTNMGSMFRDCSSLTSLDLSNFNTSNVTNMEYMFSECYKLTTTINILNANTTYIEIFTNSLTDTNAKVTIGYTSANKPIVEAMKETAGSNQSKITLKQI